MKRTSLSIVLGIVVICFLLSIPGGADDRRSRRELFPIVFRNQVGLVGFIDKTGAMVIKPQFADTWEFSEGLAPVTLEPNGLWGYIDEKGRLVIGPKFDGAFPFAKGRAMVRIGNVYGYIDPVGNIVIQPKFGKARGFSEGLAAVQIGKKWGFIDPTGKISINPVFDDAMFFTEGLAAVKSNGKWGYIDNAGKFVIAPAYLAAEGFAGGAAPVWLDGAWGFIDAFGRVIIQPRFRGAQHFSEGLAAVGVRTGAPVPDRADKPPGLLERDADKWGFIDKKGHVSIALQYEDALGFSEGLAAVQKDSKWGLWGFIDRTGSMIIQPQLVFSGLFRGGLVGAGRDLTYHRHHTYYLDKKGNAVGKLAAPREIPVDSYAQLIASANSAVYAITRYVFVDAASATKQPAVAGGGLDPLVKNLGLSVDALRSVFPRDKAYRATHGAMLSQFVNIERWATELNRALGSGDRIELARQVAVGKYWLGRLRVNYQAFADEVEITPAPGSGDAQVGTALPSPGGVINTLTHALIDSQRRTVSFIGRKDSAGPTATMPYRQFLSAALQLPEEKGPVGTLDSEPGFSLEPAGEAGPPIEQILRDRDRTSRAFNQYFETRLFSDPEFARYSFPQLKDDVIAVYQDFLSRRMASQEASALLRRVRGWGDLKALVRELAAKGVMDLQRDGPALSQEAGLAFARRLSASGNIFVLPPSAMEVMFGKRVTVAPLFLGLPAQTQLARVVMEADYALKSVFGTGGFLLKENLPFHETFLEWYARRTPASELRQRATQARPATELAAVQIVPRRISLGVSDDGSLVSFDEITLGVRAGARPGSSQPRFLDSYVEHLSKHYDQYAAQIHALWEVREVTKIIALARYMKLNGVAVSLPVDVSWSAPSQLPGHYSVTVVGLGGTQQESVILPFFTGGVSLQVRSVVTTRKTGSGDLQTVKGTLVPAVPNAEVRIGGKILQAHTIGWTQGSAAPQSGAVGRPIVSPDKLASLDRLDAKASLAAMREDELKALDASVRERETNLAAAVRRIKEKEFAAQLKATAPGGFDSWKDRLQEKAVEEIPGARFMAEVGRRAAAQLSEVEKGGGRVAPDVRQAIKDYESVQKDFSRIQQILRSGADLTDGTTRRELQKLLDVKKDVSLSPGEIGRLIKAKVRDAEQRERLIGKIGSEAARPGDWMAGAAAKVSREAWVAHRECAEATSWSECGVRAAPHVEKIIRELLPTSGDLAKYAKQIEADPTDLSRFRSKAGLYLKVAEVGIELAYQAADIQLVNEAIREKQSANHLLMFELAARRGNLEQQLRENRSLRELIVESQKDK